MSGDSIDYTPYGEPLVLLSDPFALAKWTNERDSETIDREWTKGCKQLMADHGVRSVLFVIQDMDDAMAVLEEHAV